MNNLPRLRSEEIARGRGSVRTKNIAPVFVDWDTGGGREGGAGVAVSRDVIGLAVNGHHPIWIELTSLSLTKTARPLAGRPFYIDL